jgi:hypothetical protein
MYEMKRRMMLSVHHMWKEKKNGSTVVQLTHCGNIFYRNEAKWFEFGCG